MQSTLIPISASIRPIASPLTRAASIALIGALSYSSEKRQAGGKDGHSGGARRATRPPS